MKKIIICILLSVYFIPESSANSGDTTWVTIYNLRKITQYGNYDTSAVLPTGKTYRKIRLHYILGRYACPSGTQYCGSWDYTTQVYVKPANTDTMEIARIITPYATDWLGANRKHDFVVDVSDYASVLNGNLDFRYKYDGYSWGFTLTLKLEMIEGTPPMEAIAAKNIYDGYYAYGNTSNPIENHLVEKELQLNNLASRAMVKNTISGHGSDDNGCGEFCSKYYDLKINGSNISQKQLWKSDCGKNDIYPQTGTWLYERANWCPGQVVFPINHDISALTMPATTFSVDVDFEPYVSPTQSNAGGYNVVSQLISYSAPNFITDVSIEDIISPTNDPNYFRSNNICSNPIIKIKNVGTNPITSVVFSYNLNGMSPATYTWTGNLSFLQDTIVELGTALTLYNGVVVNQFNVSILNVNGGVGDQNPDNNYYVSTFNNVKVYPSNFIIYFTTNAATSPINPGFNEAHWVLKNDAGITIASRTNLANSTVYRDTLNLPDGCYTFTADDDGCDGISWWAYQYYTPNPGSGNLRFNKISPPIPLKSFNGDFGCQVIERFIVSSSVTGVEEIKALAKFNLYPNPANSNINIVFDMLDLQAVTYTITDITGKEVKTGSFNNIGSEVYPINVDNLLTGMYFMTCKFNKGGILTQKFTVNH